MKRNIIYFVLFFNYFDVTECKKSIPSTQDIWQAAQNGIIKDVKYFINQCANVSEIRANPLMEKINRCRMMQHSLDCRQIFSDYNGTLGGTPLHSAAQYGHLDVVKVLVEETNADVNAQADCWGESLI